MQREEEVPRGVMRKGKQSTDGRITPFVLKKIFHQRSEGSVSKTQSGEQPKRAHPSHQEQRNQGKALWRREKLRNSVLSGNRRTQRAQRNQRRMENKKVATRIKKDKIIVTKEGKANVGLTRLIIVGETDGNRPCKRKVKR